MDASSRFATIACLPDGEIDLAEAAFLIASFEYPDLDVAGEVSRFESLAAAARPAVSAAEDERKKISALSRYLFSEVGLRGDTEDYENPRNSFLNDVLDRKLGIPITLSVVLLEVGRRSGVDLEGVNFPGHFLVRSAREPALIVDPFGGGRFLRREDCEELLRRATGGRIRFHPELLAPAPCRKILARMLNNLRASSIKRREWKRAIEFLGALLALEPDNGGALRDRGMVRVERGELAAGIEDLEEFLRAFPGEEGREEAAARLARAKESHFPVN